MSTSTLCQSSPSIPEPSPANQNLSTGDSALESPSKIYQEVTVVKQLAKAKFPVYLVRSKINNQHFAMKVFPYENGKPHVYYQNENRFSSLSHPNIISTFYLEHQRKTKSKGVVSIVSYKVMEYAPYGDLFDFRMKSGPAMDEKLVRTYFKQLIEGVEYLHKNCVSHMDIKPENLLIGNDFTLKISDFDLSHSKGDAKVISKGTRTYRAPELANGRCTNTYAADIYSAGIVLFTLKCQGVVPHAENHLVNGVNFSELLYSKDPQFWIEHCDLQGKDESFFDDDFRSLFTSMTSLNPEERPSIEQIKQSKWYNGPCYSAEELKTILQRVFWN